jgi:hypothetical protein
MQRPLIVQFWIFSATTIVFGNLVYDFNKGYWDGMLRTRFGLCLGLGLGFTFGSRVGTEIELGLCLSSILGGLVIKKKIKKEEEKE